ncbi:MAG: flagellar basal-body MS-ring/collar protein FliF [Pseudomonadota bacterium]
MERLVLLWGALDLRRRLALVAAGVAALAAIIAIASMSTRGQTALLYAGLDPAAAGEVISALEARGIAYEVQGTAIHVDPAVRDRVRLALAAEGLPPQGQQGYELLDGLSGFSATADMFDAAYWRAREGELARTLIAAPRIRTARVHLAVAPRLRFARDTADPTASVTVTTAGGALTTAEAASVRYLVALAVPNLAPEAVAVIDSRAGLVLGPKSDPSAAMADAAAAREARLKAELEDLISARVGAGSARVSVALTLDRTAETLSERRFDPASRVVISDDTEERDEQSQGGDDAVTVASNLPEGEGAAGAQRRSERRESRSRANYDYDETRREQVRRPGGIQRLSVAVLVDGIRETATDGSVQWQPRPAEELTALKSLVEAAVGFDAARGDTVVVETLAFQPPVEMVDTGPGLAETLIERHAMTLLQLGVLAGVVLVLVFTVLRPLVTRDPTVAPIYVGDVDPALPPADETAEAMAAVEDVGNGILLGLPDRESLRQAVADLPESSAATLRDWLEGGEEEAA